MKSINLRMAGLSCLYFLFMAFSASANAGPPGHGVTVEGWSAVGDRELPVLNFDNALIEDDLYQEIRAENFTRDKDGSMRFQLTHNGPLSRQVFAHVRRIEQDDGLTRSVITNIADGKQMEYLSPATTLPVMDDRKDKGGFDLSVEQAISQDTECPLCWWGTVIITEATCAVTTTLASYRCQDKCSLLGGVKSFNTGICGMYNSECTCMIDPKRIFDEI